MEKVVAANNTLEEYGLDLRGQTGEQGASLHNALLRLEVTSLYAISCNLEL
jgi:hypothetical protein